MKAGWTTARLDELCSFQNGLWKGKKPPFVHAGVLRNTNFGPNGVLKMEPSAIAQLDVEQRQFEKRSLETGDIILEKSGGGPKQAVGRVAFFPGADSAYSFSNFTTRCRVADRTRLEPAFLHKFLHHCYISGQTEAMQSHSTGIRNLKLDQYKTLEVPLPPLDEQRRIVAKLDDATDFVSKATEAVGVARSEADALRSQILNKAFGQRVGDAPSMELKDVCRFINGRAYKKTEFLDSGPYPVLRVGNFFTNANWVYSDLELDSEKYCEAGDLLYAWSASFGPRLWAGPKAIFHYHIWKVVPNESLVLKDYLFRLLQWDVAQIRNDHGTGATMMHVTKGNMEARTVRIPALADQRAICAEVAAADLEMDALDRALAKKSSELGALLPAILNDLIAG